jgi:hypothetical protein
LLFSELIIFSCVYKITIIYDIEFKDVIKRSQKTTDYWVKLIGDNGGKLTSINFFEGSTGNEITASDISPKSASVITSSVTTACCDCSCGGSECSPGC